MNCCLNCDTKIDNNTEYEQHKKICIYYLYNSLYQKKISNDLIKNIVEIINIFKLHHKTVNYKINKNELLESIQIEYKILNNNIQNKEKKKIEYIYNYINNNNQEIYTYKDIIDIISKLYYLSNNDILNIVNAYKISYKNCII
jgi:hypothetical protein